MCPIVSTDRSAARLSKSIFNLLADHPKCAYLCEPGVAAVSNRMDSSSGSSALRDPQQYLQVLRHLLMALFLPHVRKPPGAENQRVSTHRKAWKEIYFLARDNIRRPEWVHADNSDSANHILRELFRALGNCEYPSYIPKEVSGNRPQSYQLVCMCRMD